jgi:hypothetical protein
VDDQIAVIRERIARQLGQYGPSSAPARKGRSRTRSRGSKRARVVSAETRAKMAAAARKRWARRRREQSSKRKSATA